MTEESKLSADGLEVVGYCDPRNVQKMKSLDVCGFMVHDEPSMAISAPVILLSDAQRLLSQLREELAQRDAEVERLGRLQVGYEKTLTRVDNMWKKRWLDKTGEPAVALIVDDEFKSYFEEIKTLKARIAALESQQAASVGGERDAVDRAIDWMDCQQIAEQGDVDEALRSFSEDSTLDNATSLVIAIRAALSPAGGGVDKLLDMNELSNVIRSIVGWSNMGAGRLAEAICDRLNAKPQANSQEADK